VTLVAISLFQGPASKKAKVGDDMEALERQMMEGEIGNLAGGGGGKAGDVIQMGGGEFTSDAPAAPAAKNTDEIDIDDDDDEEMDGGEGAGGGGGGAGGGAHLKAMAIEEKAAPASLYGSLLQEGEEPQGALARFRAQK
jgi:hypothetical protein